MEWADTEWIDHTEWAEMEWVNTEWVDYTKG